MMIHLLTLRMNQKMNLKVQVAQTNYHLCRQMKGNYIDVMLNKRGQQDSPLLFSTLYILGTICI